MVRLLAIVALISLPIFASCSNVDDSISIDRYKNNCTKVGGSEVEGFLCYADSYSIISAPEKYCGMLVSTFGYVSEDWSGLNLYPGKSRAISQVIFSGISLSDEIAVDALRAELLSSAVHGVYVDLTGNFSCVDKRVDVELGAGRLSGIIHLAVSDIDENDVFVRSRSILPE